jgi:hypothetical protein
MISMFAFGPDLPETEVIRSALSDDQTAKKNSKLLSQVIICMVNYFLSFR